MAGISHNKNLEIPEWYLAFKLCSNSKRILKITLTSRFILEGNTKDKGEDFRITISHRKSIAQILFPPLIWLEVLPKSMHLFPDIQDSVLCVCSVLSLCDLMSCSPPGSSVHGDSVGKNTGVGCHALLQGIFPTQGSNPGLPHWRCILSLGPIEPPEKPKNTRVGILPFSRGSFRPRNQTASSCIAGGRFTTWTTRDLYRTLLSL